MMKKMNLFRGVPCKHMRDIILDMFKLKFIDNDTKYKATLETVFKNKQIPKIFKNVPLFGLKWEEDED